MTNSDYLLKAAIKKLTEKLNEILVDKIEEVTNIAMGYVPYDGTLNANGFPKGKPGSKYKIHLPEKYSEKPGEPVDAVVVDIPFTESYNANTREVVKG